MTCYLDSNGGFLISLSLVCHPLLSQFLGNFCPLLIKFSLEAVKANTTMHAIERHNVNDILASITWLYLILAFEAFQLDLCDWVFELRVQVHLPQWVTARSCYLC